MPEPKYASPEFFGEGPVLAWPWIDLYALGIVAAGILYGPDFDKLATADPDPIIAWQKWDPAQLKAPAPWNKGLDPILFSVVLKLMSRDPSVRYAHARDALADLSPKGQAAVKMTRRRSKLPLAVTLITIVTIVALLAGAGFWLFRDHPTPTVSQYIRPNVDDTRPATTSYVPPESHPADVPVAPIPPLPPIVPHKEWAGGVLPDQFDDLGLDPNDQIDAWRLLDADSRELAYGSLELKNGKYDFAPLKKAVLAQWLAGGRPVRIIFERNKLKYNPMLVGFRFDDIGLVPSPADFLSIGKDLNGKTVRVARFTRPRDSAEVVAFYDNGKWVFIDRHAVTVGQYFDQFLLGTSLAERRKWYQAALAKIGKTGIPPGGMASITVGGERVQVAGDEALIEKFANSTMFTAADDEGLKDRTSRVFNAQGISPVRCRHAHVSRDGAVGSSRRGGLEISADRHFAAGRAGVCRMAKQLRQRRAMDGARSIGPAQIIPGAGDDGFDGSASIHAATGRCRYRRAVHTLLSRHQRDRTANGPRWHLYLRHHLGRAVLRR